jgi:hypothetical protein
MVRIVKFIVSVFRPRNEVGSLSLPRSQCACLSEL